MITLDTIRSLTIEFDSRLFDQMIASSGKKAMGEFSILGSILQIIDHGTPVYIRKAGEPDIARLETRNGLIFVQAIPNDLNA